VKLAILIRRRPDGQYVAHCPSLPGCTARADSRERVERKMRDAIAGYLASMDASLPPRMVMVEARETVFR
jgi:predicted RNase H-like HicB family nuclease